MEFTYASYRSLLGLLRENNYTFTDYHRYGEQPRCVILRHDIDNSLPQALRLAELEAEEGVKSTWFVLLRTDFYNPASAASQKLCAASGNWAMRSDCTLTKWRTTARAA